MSPRVKLSALVCCLIPKSTELSNYPISLSILPSFMNQCQCSTVLSVLPALPQILNQVGKVIQSRSINYAAKNVLKDLNFFEFHYENNVLLFSKSKRHKKVLILCFAKKGKIQNIFLSVKLNKLNRVQCSESGLYQFPYCWPMVAAQCQNTTSWWHDIHHDDNQRNDTQHNDTQHNDTQNNDTQHNDTQHNDAQHNDAQHNDIQHNDNQHNDTQHKGFIWNTAQVILSTNDSLHSDALPLC